MAIPHADFQAKRCSDGLGNPKTEGLGVRGPPSHPPGRRTRACTASKGLLMGYL
jgi:hypothetical protein